MPAEAAAAWDQANYLGGEWSTYSQGRTDLPAYRTALALCRNSMPLEVGAWTRRSGTCHGGFTNRGKIARLFRYRFSWKDDDLICEVSFDGTNSWLRFWYGPELLTDVITANQNVGNAGYVISSWTANTPAKFVTTADTDWSTGDDVVFYSDQSANARNGNILLGRVFSITKIGVRTFTIADAVSGATFASSAVNFDSGVTNMVARVTKIQLPFTSASDLATTRIVVGGNISGNLGLFGGLVLLILNPNYWPFAVAATKVPTAPGFPVFTSNTQAAFTDGPYINSTLGTVTASAATGDITFTLTGTPYPNNSTGWLSTDVGRPVRIYSEPAQWAIGTAYNQGDVVTVGTYPNSTFHTAFTANTGNNPLTTPSIWSVTPNPGRLWTWGKIKTYSSGTVVTLTIEGPAIYNTSNIVTWLEGLYSATWGYPTCGLFHEGRIWLNSSFLNGRFDGSCSGDFFNFSPDAGNYQGIETDNSAISYQIGATGTTPIYYMAQDSKGIIVGMKNAEWVLSAGTSPEAPMTPTDIRARNFSAIGGANQEAVRCGSAIAFIQNSTKQIIEYVTDTFSNKFGGRPLDINATHLTAPGVQRIEWQGAKTPILWALTTAGRLLGCTYRRIATYIDRPPEFFGWHKHDLGTAWTVQDICAGEAGNNTDETLYLCTNDGSKYHVEMLEPIFDESRDRANGWFLDSSPTTWTGGTATQYRQLIGYDPALSSGSAGITFYGLAHLAGLTVTVFVAGLNCGTVVVGADGSAAIAYASDPEGLLTTAYLIAQSGTASTMFTAGTQIDIKSGGSQTRVVVPVTIGLPYTSEGQTVRPNDQQGAHTPTGPSLAETRRVVQYGFLTPYTGPFNVGTSSSSTYPARLVDTNRNTALGASTMFTGVMWDICKPNLGYDGQLYWSCATTYPMTITASISFLGTAERDVGDAA